MDQNVPHFVSEPPVFRGEEQPEFFKLPKFDSPTGIELDLNCQIPKDNGLIESNYGTYARKCFKLAPLSRLEDFHSDKEKFEQELAILYHAQHRHVIELVYAYIFEPVKDGEDESNQTSPHAAIIMVLAESFRPTLSSAQMQDPKMLSDYFEWFSCLAITLDHIHGVGIRHRDIKPENILVKNDNEVVLADFGISNMILGRTLSTTSPGAPRARTIMYCAPEVESGSSRTRSADIFALGAVFLAMLAALRPSGRTELEYAFASGGKEQDQGQSYSTALRSVHELINRWRGKPKGKVWKDREGEWNERLSMCQNMMNEDPYRRPDAFDIVSRISKIKRREPGQPCKCSNPPDEPGARLIYICKNGLTNDLHLLDLLEALNNTVGAIQQASARGHLKILKTLLDNRFDVNLPDHSGQTALHCAAAFGEDEVVKYLLDRPGIRPDIEDHKKRTALHYAAGNGSLQVVKLLLENRQGRLDANKKDEDERIALHFAATRGHNEIIDELLVSRATENVDATDKNGITALHLAAGYGSVQAVGSLLHNGANANKSEKSKKQWALNFAVDGIQKLDETEDRGQYEKVIELLLPETKKNIRMRVACVDAPEKACTHQDSHLRMVCDSVAD